MMRVLGVLAFVVSVAMVWRLKGSASDRVSWRLAFRSRSRPPQFVSWHPAGLGRAAVMPLALLGWSSRRTPFADRVIVTIGAYLCAFMLIGRPENVYWGIMFVLLLISGVAFAPTAVVDLLRGRSHVKLPPVTVHAEKKCA